MKRIISSLLIIFSILSIQSCQKYNTDPKDIWVDPIKLSTKSAKFNAAGDSILIETGGNLWWITNVSVDDIYYSNFPEVNRELEYYSIKQDCFVVEHRNNNSLFIKVDENPFNVNRIITVGLEANDYFGRVRVTQESK